MEKVNLTRKFESFAETWVPKIVGELNGQFVKLVKFEGEQVWHQHENEDELFLVLKGEVTIHLRDSTVELADGDFFIVPRGIEHKPAAPRLAHVLLFEPASTRNTGNVDHRYTIDPDNLQRIQSATVATLLAQEDVAMIVRSWEDNHHVSLHSPNHAVAPAPD